jgi:hypothetical protein
MKTLPAVHRKNAMTLLRNERGLLMLDFMFALVFAIGFSTVFFSIAVTLSLVEVAQYVTFATSRSYAAAHETKALQTELAQAKFNDIMAVSSFKTFLGSNWIKVGELQLGDFSEEYDAGSEIDNRIFVGARLPIDAKLLHWQVPFIGPTIEASDIGKATLNSFLMREVSTSECREQFTSQRYQQLKNIDAAYQATPNSQAEKLITDNGC